MRNQPPFKVPECGELTVTYCTEWGLRDEDTTALIEELTGSLPGTKE